MTGGVRGQSVTKLFGATKFTGVVRPALAWAVVLLMVCAVPCQGQIIFVFQEGVDGYTGTADTFFQTGDPAWFNVHGDAAEWEWDGSDAGGMNYGLLRFDNIIGTDPGQIPPGSTVISAILTLTITNSGSADQIATVHDLLRPFTEEMAFADFTEEFEAIPGTDYLEEVVAEIPGPTAGDIIDVDVTSSLQRWVGGAENLGWIVIPGGTNGVGVQSSEAPPLILPTLEVNTPIGKFTFRDGLNGYDGTADTWINSGNGVAEVYGEQTHWEWDGSDNGGSNYGLLRFDDIIGTGTGQIPPGTTIDSAVIRFSIVDQGSTGTVHEILAGAEGESTFFDNSNTTFLDFGDGFEPWPGVHYAEDPVGEVPGEVGLVELDVTDTIRKYSAGEPNRGWIFVPTGGNGVEVISSEATAGGGPPKLTVTIEGAAAVNDFWLR